MSLSTTQRRTFTTLLTTLRSDSMRSHGGQSIAREIEDHMTDLNNAIDEYNTYIEFKNHQFSPSKPDDEIEKMIPDIEKEMEWYENISLELSLLENEDINNSINQNAKNINELKKRLNEEKSFVSLYLSTKKNNRRDLFYKKTYTLFGIPIK